MGPQLLALPGKRWGRPEGRRDRRRQWGFTLIELLVVVGIIAVLVSILVPVVSRARVSAQRTACLANLRSIGQAMISFTGDFGGKLPNDTAPGTYQPDNSMVLVYMANKYVASPKAFWCPGTVTEVPSIPGSRGIPRLADPNFANGYTCLPDSARVSYEFLSVWWPSDLGPDLMQMSGNPAGVAPLAWDNDGGDDQSGTRNHDHGGNVIFADGHGEWQPIERWEGKSWPRPAQEYLPVP